jgi:hypothetical protein
MFHDENQPSAGVRTAPTVGMWCALACLGLWLGTSGIFARAGQQGSAITGTEHDPAKRETPFAGSLEKSLSKEQREYSKQLALKMESARIETKELANGYVFRFRPEAVSFLELAEWVATERVCCPFFDLPIESERENGPLALRITRREGVKQFIRMEFRTLKLP